MPGYWNRRESRNNAGERKRDDGTILLLKVFYVNLQQSSSNGREKHPY